jgi:hypothetical protein
MIITNHWSVSGPVQLNAYHLEFALIKPLPEGYNAKLGQSKSLSSADQQELHSFFQIWKNVDFDTVTSYGTFDMNHDPRDMSPNIEIAAMCMGGDNVNTSGPWGIYPYTYAHFWMHAALSARVAKLKSIDTLGNFGIGPWPHDNNMTYQNGPLWNISTHGERAIQTPDGPDSTLRPNFGYYIFSGDPDSRWDIAVPDVSEANKLSTPQGAFNASLATAMTLRNFAHQIKEIGIEDMWGLDK